MKFVNRLTSNQVESFLKQHGIIASITWNPNTYCAHIGNSNNTASIIRFSDKQIYADRSFELSSYDWQVYLRSVFGNRYMRFLKKKDFHTKMMSELSIDDILELLKFNNIYDFRECEPLIKGTRRFKCKYEYDGPHHDIVIAPYFSFGNIKHYGISEEEFESFMIGKFSNFYIAYCLEMRFRQLIKQAKELSKSQKSHLKTLKEKDLCHIIIM